MNGNKLLTNGWLRVLPVFGFARSFLSFWVNNKFSILGSRNLSKTLRRTTQKRDLVGDCLQNLDPYVEVFMECNKFCLDFVPAGWV